MVLYKSTFEIGGVYRCEQDTHLIDYSVIKKRSKYRISQRAIRIRKGDIITCLESEMKIGQIEAVFLVNDEIIRIKEHSSTLRALQKAFIKMGHIQ